MKALFLALTMVVSLASTAALAADTTQPAPPTPAKKQGFDPNAIVCKEVEVTGSHLPGQRVCMTWAQWDAQSQATEREMTDAEHRPAAAGGSGFGSSSGGGRGMGR